MRWDHDRNVTGRSLWTTRVIHNRLVAGMLVLAGCAAAPAQPSATGAATAETAMMQFPSPGTQWITRSENELGRSWLTVSRVLDADTYHGRPVFRVSDGQQTHFYDRATRSFVATLSGATERLSVTPDWGNFRWPLAVGNSWQATYALRDNQYGVQYNRVVSRWQVTALEEVRVPAGAFRAFRLEGHGGTRSQVVWYAPEMRLIVKAVEERGPRDRAGPGRVVTELIDSTPPGAEPWYPMTFEAVQEALQRGQGRQARVFYERTAARLLERGLSADALEALDAYLWVSRSLGAYQETIKVGLRALALLATQARTDQLTTRGLSIRLTLGLAYLYSGAHGEAQRIYEEGVALAPKLPQPQQRLYWTGVFGRALAAAAWFRGDFVGAARYGESAIGSLESYLAALPLGASSDRFRRVGRWHLAWALDITAKAMLRQGDLSRAEPLFARAIEIARELKFPELELSASMGLAHAVLSKGDLAESATRFEEARTLARRLGNPGLLMFAANGLGSSYFRSGNYGQALDVFREAVDVAEGVRASLQDEALRSSFLDDKQAVYHGAVQSASQLGRADEAFAFAERSRARAFLDLLGTGTVLSKGKTRTLVAEETRLRAQLAEAKAALSAEPDEAGTDAPAPQRAEAAERAYRTFLERVRRDSAEQVSLMTVEPVTLAEVQHLLPEGITLVEYLVTEAETFAWVIDRSRAKLERLPVARSQLVAEVRAFRQGIEGQAPLPDAQARAQALHERLVARLRPLIQTDRLLFVPHDVLHYLPFGALRSGSGRWLVEDYTLSTLPSASVLRYLADKGAATASGILAIGNPDIGPALDLHFAEREARAVGARYPMARVLVRTTATEARVKALGPEMGLIHFATHSELDERDPLGSALLLVPGDGEDGRLEVREVFGLDLHARLVVLSACETGLGKLTSGDELVGLQRAFLYAGTPAVVTTQWKVDDRSSFLLMQTFYERLAAGDAARALREAQQAAMRQYPHPFNWAAFGLTGVSR